MDNQLALDLPLPPAKEITDELKGEAENQIVEKQRDVDYDTKEYPVETIVQKYSTGLEKDENELFVPDYQREFAWDKARQSKFIESVLIGLPIPYIFVADVGDKVENEGRLEIVDGSQRIRTLAAFTQDRLILEGLHKLEKLNGFRFSDLPLSRQRRFNRRTIRMIELTEKADEEVRRDIFERINTGSEELNDMEKRRGIQQGAMLEFLEECARHPLLAELAPLSKSDVMRREREEFVLRFFAYLNEYKNFAHSVNKFLNDYLKKMNEHFAKGANQAERDSMRAEFARMLEFVKRYIPNGFKKGKKHTTTPRIRFEAISVGTALALREDPMLQPKSVGWADSEEFRSLTTSDASNSRPKLIRRTEYVRDMLLHGVAKA